MSHDVDVLADWIEMDNDRSHSERNTMKISLFIFQACGTTYLNRFLNSSTPRVPTCWKTSGLMMIWLLLADKEAFAISQVKSIFVQVLESVKEDVLWFAMF